MADEPSTDAQPTVHDAIMAATYRALCKHGYADLTMQSIAEEFEKSKSLIHYHFDTKQELLTAFMEYMLERFEEQVESAERADPAEQLAALLERFLTGPDEFEEFQTAMLELRSQAPYNEAYRAQFRENDEYVRNLVVSVVERGIETGTFRDVDPERTASFLLAVVDGARTRWIVLGDDRTIEDVRGALSDYIEAELLK